MMRLIGTLLLFGFLGTFLDSAYADLSDGLVCHFTFSGNANDESGHGHDGKVYGATLCEDRFGRANEAYRFDGYNDYIKADATGLPKDERTTSLWFYANTLGTRPILLAYGGNGGPPGTSHCLNINGGGIPAITVGNHWGSYALFYYYSVEPVGQWVHLAATVDVNGTKMYVNGYEVASNGIYINNTYVDGKDLALGVHVSPYGIAPYSDGNCGYLDGMLDDIRVYNRSLSHNEIKELHLSEQIFCDIKANGSDDHLTIDKGMRLQIEVSIAPGNLVGEAADWWTLARTGSDWYHYNLIFGGFTPGFCATHQGPMHSMGPDTVYNGASLPVGKYFFYFGVDLNMNGSPDVNQIVYDLVVVVVQ